MRTVTEHPASAPGGTKARIQQAALELFAVNGYEKTSLREIADRLNVTKAALYYHYASKQELLKSITQPLFDELEELLAQEDDLRGLLHGYVEILARNRPVFEIFATDHASLVAAEIAERSVALRREMFQRLTGPDPSPADLIRASAALGAVNQGFVLAHRFDPAVSASASASASVSGAVSAGDSGPGGPAPDVVYPEGEELAELLIGIAFTVLGRGTGHSGGRW